MKDWRWAKAFQNASLNQNKLGNSTQKKKTLGGKDNFDRKAENGTQKGEGRANVFQLCIYCRDRKKRSRNVTLGKQRGKYSKRRKKLKKK
jgi:hypothetical protein